MIAFTWGEKGLFAAGKMGGGTVFPVTSEQTFAGTLMISEENCLEISDIDVALRRLEIASQYKDDQPFARG